MTKENIKLNDYYSTSDLALATTISLYYPLEVVDHTNSHKAQFLFKQSESLKQLVEAFWRKELKVDPQTYFNQLKIIKSRLYGEG